MARRRSSGITSLGFNQNQDCFTCCLRSGLRVYNVEPLVEKAHYSKEELGEVSLCEMVFRSNLLLLVKARRPCSLLLLDDQRRAFKAEVAFKTPIRALRARRDNNLLLLVKARRPCSLLLLDDQRRAFKAEVAFKTPIRALRARRDKVAVVLSSSIQVLTLPSLQRVALLRTPQAARPLCALAIEPNAVQVLAAPAHRKGSLQILDISRAVKGAQSSSPAVVGCHQTALVCLSVSANGAKLATASERGTIIRIWDTTSKLLLHELRRGSDYADVYCINFNPSGSLVCCVSDKGTLHVWAARGSYAHLASASAEPDTRALCAFSDDANAVGESHTICGPPRTPAICGPPWTPEHSGPPRLLAICGPRTPEDSGPSRPRVPPAQCVFRGNSVVVVCEDGTFHKFTFSAEGNCHRNDFEYFLQVGDDDEFLQ